MPTASDQALAERDLWLDLSSRWTKDEFPHLWDDRPPTEAATVVFFDPTQDLARRAADWGHVLAGSDLSSLSAFASGLAELESESWSTDKPDLATRAYEARRFLLGDRVIHWAVPWLDSIGRCYPAHRQHAYGDRDSLLALADEMRVAPELAGPEGIRVPGEDSFGPTENGNGDVLLSSLWSGALILRGMGEIEDLTTFYETSAGRWETLADGHPGSGQLWVDLADRAVRTAGTH